VKLTLRPENPAVWAARSRGASVVVAWQRAPALGSLDDGQRSEGLDRAVLAEGKPLVVDGAATFAIAFADSFATGDRDSVTVNFEPTTDAPPEPQLAPARPVTPSGGAAPEPADPSEALSVEGARLLNDKQYSAAKTQLEKCIERAPKNAACHRLLGATRAKLNKPTKAVTEYETFLKLAPEGDPDRQGAQEQMAELRKHGGWTPPPGPSE